MQQPELDQYSSLTAGVATLSDAGEYHDYPEPNDMTAAPRNSTNVLAIVALVLSFLGLTSIFGVICGHVARRQIRATRAHGDSLAVAALWVGYCYISAAVLCLVVYFAIAGQGS